MEKQLNIIVTSTPKITPTRNKFQSRCEEIDSSIRTMSVFIRPSKSRKNENCCFPLQSKSWKTFFNKQQLLLTERLGRGDLEGG
jgi:hypothetical protein